MKKSRFKRNLFSICVGIGISVLLFSLNVTPKKINNYSDFMSGILSVSSMTTGLLFASFALIPALPNSRLLQNLKKLKTDKKLLDRLLVVILGFLFCSVFALIALSFKETDTSLFSKVIISITGGLFCFSLSEQIKVIWILMKVVEKL